MIRVHEQEQGPNSHRGGDEDRDVGNERDFHAGD
eukprot:CAMPEP_0194409662 /NCGR_PEP_ID=MMETSP0176-20130528/7555_1 /TAXON_ID=216777 /ORGANISM="Proboscia alata, Strain PI-D3" /LENGTH=33 /DNA_ID= /DNA_START= /DNA_END= /DNA_ORIENTATION=